MQIFIKMPTGKTIALKVESNTTLADVSKQIEAKEGVPAEKQRFVCCGIVLDNLSATLEGFDIKNDSTLQLVDGNRISKRPSPLPQAIDRLKQYGLDSKQDLITILEKHRDPIQLADALIHLHQHGVLTDSYATFLFLKPGPLIFAEAITSVENHGSLSFMNNRRIFNLSNVQSMAALQKKLCTDYPDKEGEINIGDFQYWGGTAACALQWVTYFEGKKKLQLEDFFSCLVRLSELKDPQAYLPDFVDTIFEHFSKTPRPWSALATFLRTLGSYGFSGPQGEQVILDNRWFWPVLNDDRLRRRLFTLTNHRNVNLFLRHLLAGGEDRLEENLRNRMPEEFEENIPHNNLVANAQSTHTASVHQSASESAQALYNLINPDREFFAKQWDALQGEMQGAAMKLAEGDGPEVRCIKRLHWDNFRDPVSNLSNHELLLLCHYTIGQMKDKERQDHAYKALNRGLYDIQRGYNLDDSQSRDAPDMPICSSGSFNKLIECMVGYIPECNIIYVTHVSIAYKTKVFVIETLLSQEGFASKDELLAVLPCIDNKDRSLASIWPKVKNHVGPLVREYFEGSVDRRMVEDVLSVASDINFTKEELVSLHGRINNSPAQPQEILKGADHIKPVTQPIELKKLLTPLKEQQEALKKRRVYFSQDLSHTTITQLGKLIEDLNKIFDDCNRPIVTDESRKELWVTCSARLSLDHSENTTFKKHRGILRIIKDLLNNIANLLFGSRTLQPKTAQLVDAVTEKLRNSLDPNFPKNYR